MRIIGGDRVPCKVPQRGGNEGDWIDVRPRRRKALQQDFQGQNRDQDGQRLRDRDVFKVGQSRVRLAPREERYYKDFD